MYRVVCIIHQNGVSYWCILHILWNARWNRERKNLSLWTIMRNWGNSTISVAVLKLFEGEQVITPPWRVSNWAGRQTPCRGKWWERASSHLTYTFSLIFWSHVSLGRRERPAAYISVCWSPRKHDFPGHELTRLSIRWTNCCYKHKDAKVWRWMSGRRWQQSWDTSIASAVWVRGNTEVHQHLDVRTQPTVKAAVVWVSEMEEAVNMNAEKQWDA